MKRKVSKKDIRRIEWAIGWHFGIDDEYAEKEKILSDNSLEILIERNKKKEIVAYLIFLEYTTHIEGIRSGVFRDYRGQGLSKKLYKRLMRIAKLRKKPYKTYTHYTNIKSINAHISAGMRLYHADAKQGWVYLISDT